MTDDHIILMSWTRAIPGREAIAGELFQSSLTWFKRQVEQGNIAGAEPYLLTANGGDINGFIIVRGSSEALTNLSHHKDYENLVVQANLCLQNFAVINGYRGSRVTEMMNAWKTYASKF